MHSLARKGRRLIFENRKLEIKENYNSYNEIDDRKIVFKARWEQSNIRTIEHSNIRTFPKVSC